MLTQSQPTGKGRAASGPLRAQTTLQEAWMSSAPSPRSNNAEDPLANPIKEAMLLLPRKYTQFQGFHGSLEALMSPRLGFPF